MLYISNLRGGGTWWLSQNKRQAGCKGGTCEVEALCVLGLSVLLTSNVIVIHQYDCSFIIAGVILVLAQIAIPGLVAGELLLSLLQGATIPSPPPTLHPPYPCPSPSPCP